MVKRDALDAVFSDVIREASDWICQRCGREFPERKGQDAHCSHYISRKFSSVRWFPDNASLLCASCHSVVTDDPAEHYEHVVRLLGVERLDRLRARKNEIRRYKAEDKNAMRGHYRAELERIRLLRREGVVGAVEVIAYD